VEVETRPRGASVGSINSASNSVWRYLAFIVTLFGFLALLFSGFDAFSLWQLQKGFNGMNRGMSFFHLIGAGEYYGKGRWLDHQQCQTLVGTKTPYARRCLPLGTTIMVPPKSCKPDGPTSMLHIARHGTRALDPDDKSKVSALGSIQDKCIISGSCPSWIRHWSPPPETELWEKQLLDTGRCAVTTMQDPNHLLLPCSASHQHHFSQGRAQSYGREDS